MKQKIQLLHPAGKKAVKMDQEKYDIVSKALLDFLMKNENATQSEILNAVLQNFQENKINFYGSIEWHMEWVKLDLEARNKIKRLPNESPFKYKKV